MAKKKATKKTTKQQMLFETLPKSLEAMRPHMDEYLEAKAQRQAAGLVESEKKKTIMDIILKAKLKARDDGHVVFTFGGIEWDVEPTGFSLHTKKAKDAKPEKD